MAHLEDQFLNVTEFATIADVRPSEPPTADMVQVMQAIRGQPHQRSSHINIILMLKLSFWASAGSVYVETQSTGSN